MTPARRARAATPLTAWFVATLAVALFAACRSTAPPIVWQSPVGRDHPLAGRIWDVPGGRFVDEQAAVDDLARARYVVLGETHDNADHHTLQARLVRALIASGRRPVVAFEMLTPSQAPALARHLAARPRDAAGIGAAVSWNASGWPEWSLYQPIAAAALDAGLPIVAANLDAAQTRAIRQGSVAALDRRFVDRWGLANAPSADVAVSMTDEIRIAHCGHAPEQMLAGMIATQRARDAAMAEAMLDLPERDGAVLIAGAGHARTDRGVPAAIRRVTSDARTASVGFVEVEAKRRDPIEYGDRFGGRLPFDYAWFTPAVDDADPCEKFRKPLERIKR